VVPLSNQVTTLNHKRFKGFKMFSDGHLGRPASSLADNTGQIGAALFDHSHRQLLANADMAAWPLMIGIWRGCG